MAIIVTHTFTYPPGVQSYFEAHPLEKAELFGVLEQNYDDVRTFISNEVTETGQISKSTWETEDDWDRFNSEESINILMDKIIAYEAENGITRQVTIEAI